MNKISFFAATVMLLCPAVLVAAPLRDASVPSNMTAGSVKVSYADLDLTNSAGKARLDRRVRYAADMVCGVSDTRDLSLLALSMKCRREALARVESQVALATEKANRLPRNEVASQPIAR